MKKKRKVDRQVQKILSIVCLSFLLGILGGAAAANLLPAGEQGALSFFLSDAVEGKEVPSFGVLFWKYLKYDLIIFLGGWMQMGLFLSGAAFLFRGISVGFTSAMLLSVYGAKGILLAVTSFLPQNILLIPAYVLMMSSAVYYMLHWQEEGKRALKRERRRRQTEYCILFGVSILLLLGAAGMERMILMA